jgi:hypothetical protein
MPHVQLNDNVFEAAKQRAAAGGYSNIDDYVADVVVQDLGQDSVSFDDVFTPDRIASLEQISQEIEAGGKTHSMADVREHFQNRRKQWLGNTAT